MFESPSTHMLQNNNNKLSAGLLAIVGTGEQRIQVVSSRQQVPAEVVCVPVT